MKLKSRAEVQLVDVLNQKKASSASVYLKEEQEKELEDVEEDYQQSHSRNRIALEALPASSEEARVISEVRQLEDDYYVVGSENNQIQHKSVSESPRQIELNDIRRRDHHTEAQTQYAEEVKVISEDLEVAIIRVADHVKEVLAAIDEGIREAKVALTNSQLLLASGNESILSMWRGLEAVCQRRTDEIAHFAAELEQIEQTRIHRVRIGLQRLTCVLMETAHALPPEVERIIEAEAHEVNTVVICNRRVYADLVARMDTANVDVFLDARLSWEQGQIRWRHLRHDSAIAKFQETLNSSLFTDPEERQLVFEQIRVFQDKVHREQRLDVLKQLGDAGASLTSSQGKGILEELSATQHYEEDKNHSFFAELRRLHEAKGEAAKTLREALRLELHGFGAMAKEGAVEEAKRTLVALLSDDSMEDFFRTAGGLKAELDALAKQLCIADLIYNDNLEPVVASVGVLCSALPLESVMEKQGKEAERKAVQSTLEKIRKASKGEIMTLLPGLQTQISMLMNLEGMNDSFKGELGDILTQLDVIIQDFASLQASGTASPSPLKRTGTMSPINTSAGVASEKTASSPPSVSVTLNSPKSTRKSSAMLGGNTNESTQSSGNLVDLVAIRKVQRRLGTLLYASELGEPWQQHLHFIADQLQLQTQANSIVDQVIARECDDLMGKRQQESLLLVEEMGKRMEQQSAQLHDQVEKVAKFFLRVVLCMEESADKVQYVNLSVMDLLDTLKDNNEESLAGLETKFTQSCARLRHSPTDSVLRDEFQRSLSFLMLIEEEYRAYDKRLSLAADNNVVAIGKQRLLYLQRLCDFFGLRQLARVKSDDTFNLDYFLSVEHIEKVLSLSPDTTTTEQSASDSEPPLEENTFRTTSGLELAVVLSLAALVQGILERTEDESGDLDSERTEASNDPTERREGEQNQHADATESDSDLQQQTVLEKVATEFLVLDVPSSTVETLLASFRESILSKYDSDAANTCSQTEAVRDERHASSAMLLEERLRVHWPRKGRLDVQFYQPRMGELLNHQQRQERYLRGVWIKVDEQQLAFANKVKEALEHVEHTRITQISFQAQLPLQLSLAALQGLEVKAKKHLGVFKGEARDKVAALRAMTESDISSLLSSCQDFVRACSSQLFPDLTSCEIISGCDYHPEEIAATKERLAALEAQARDQISERERQILDISTKQSQVLDIWQDFKARYQVYTQSLAMKEGLGQKFGLPRRAAQERYRSEMTRCESRSAAIDELLSSLDSVASQGNRPPDLTGYALRILMQLRAKIYHRGMKFGFLRCPSQLEPKAVEYDPSVGQEKGEAIRDVEVVDEEDRTLAVPFLEFADQVGLRCQEETKRLYQQEGKMEELPPSGVPAALEEYLATQLEKAQAFVVQQEVSYREQVASFVHLLSLVPGIVVMDFVEQAKQQMQRSIAAVGCAFEAQYQSYTQVKSQHSLELRPNLCSLNNAQLLRELEERERVRSESTRLALLGLRIQFLTEQIQLSLVFEARFVKLCQCLMQLLDSSVLSLDDLKSFSQEEPPKVKRKSLKRLRKVARVNEHGDPKEVKRTSVEQQKLTQNGETPRFPLRSWPRIPSFGVKVLWEEVKAEVLAKDSTGLSLDSSSSTASTVQDLACIPLVSIDGACVTLLTSAHRALVRVRDSAYGDYVNFCSEATRCFLEHLHERLEDEVKWTLSWEKGIDSMRKQQKTG
ncbi:hypothetical protein DVH05_019485 [Phytophthora capsici]|nr:hypothetical protein DVH05_019485 [Phytophthora capsici]